MGDSDTLFGTDGIRGTVGIYPLTADFMLRLGWATGVTLANKKEVKVLIGKDTRISGYMIESALQAGLSSAGVNVYLLGPMPTPGIAYLTRTFRAEKGIVISASHNNYNDNGIKFFSTDGFKANKKFQETIEHYLSQPIKTNMAGELGKAWRVDDAQGRYIEYCKSSVPHTTNFTGLKIVIDCANGATYHIAPHVFTELGAHVIPVGVSPDGLNINVNCGSNHPEFVRQKVLEEKADLGISFDGDGDRVVMVDSCGEILDGDELLFIIANNLFSKKYIQGGVVGTQMTNVGLELAFKDRGIDFLRVPVGEHHVIEALRNKKWVLGGESSGHIVFLNVTTTADGIISALQVLQAVSESKKDLHTLKQGVIKFPRCLINLPHNNKIINLEESNVSNMIKKSEQKLGKNGRILIRYSGTEPILRIMVEGENEGVVTDVAHDINDKITTLLKA